MPRIRSFLKTAAIVASITFGSSSQFAWGADIEPTHKQSAIIKMADSEESMPINAFCLSKSGYIIAACGTGPGEVRMLDDTGKIIQSWKVDVKPEAVAVGANDTVLVGGEGKLYQFDSKGKLILEADSPHAKALRSNMEQLRDEAAKSLQSNGGSVAARLNAYRTLLERYQGLSKDRELTATETKTLEAVTKLVTALESEEEAEVKAPNEAAITNQVNALLSSKMRISSISSSGDKTFVATRSQQGYGYDVWSMDSTFENGEIIVSGLSGCCGQMDVQCCEDGLFVAENSRHRVVRYDTQGKEVTQWGGKSTGEVEGFTSCCNPMNVCFGSKGSVYTAESGTGRIKQFDADGKMISYIGEVELVPGCKNVSIAASSDNSKVYMLDLTRNHIVMMTPKSDESDASKPQAETPKKKITLE